MGKVVAYEEEFAGRDGPGSSRVIALQEDRYVILVECSGLDDPLPWERVKEIAGAQAAKTRQIAADG